MITDHQFHSSSSGLRKAALLLIIPCAILPMLIALGSFLNLPVGWAYFKYDALAAGAIYGFYLYGLALSRNVHGNPWPFAIFFLHASFIILHQFFFDKQWASYLAVVSLISASLVNQFHRMGTLACTDCCQPNNQLD